MNFVYLVIHDGPCGVFILKAFTSKERADRFLQQHNQNVDNEFDKVYIVRKEIIE